jgi:hypothetical protein
MPSFSLLYKLTTIAFKKGTTLNPEGHFSARNFGVHGLFKLTFSLNK